MPLYLDTYAGAGVRLAPYVPTHSLGVQGWAATDLRPDPTLQAGRCLLYSPVTLPADVAGGLEPIADTPTDTLTAARRNRVFNALGESFAGADNRADTILKDLLFTPRARWNAVQPSIGRAVREVEFQGQVWATEKVGPLRRIDMDPADDFTRANETPLAGLWTQATGSAIASNLTSNRVLVVAGPGLSIYRRNAEAYGNDQFSEMSVSALGDNADWGPTARIAAAAQTMYAAPAYIPGEIIFKWVATVQTTVASITASNITTGVVQGLRCEGSTIRYLRNGVSQGSGTDTSIASGVAGMFIFDAATRVQYWGGGNWPGSFPPRRRNKMRHMVVR